jgi:hypothetical protein
MAVASLLDVLRRSLGQQDRGLSVYYPGHHYLEKTGLWMNNSINNNNNNNNNNTKGREQQKQLQGLGLLAMIFI